MTRPLRPILPLLTLTALIALAAGCQESDSLILARKAACPMTGPFLLRMSQTAATVAWHMPEAAPASITWWADGQAPTTFAVEAQEFEYPKLPPVWKNFMMVQPDCPMLKAYRYDAKLTGLTPGAKYHYRVKCQDVTAAASFRTVPTQHDAFTFIAYGDSRTGTEAHLQLARQFMAHDPAFILHTGDMVSNDHYPQWKPNFFDPLAEVVDRVMLQPAIGNHERGGRSYAAVFETSPGQFWHSFDYGNAHFVSIDNVSMRFGRGDMIPMMHRWLEDDLAKSKADWKFVYYHTPSYDMSYHRGEWGRETFLPLFRKLGVDMIFGGDSHTYQRFRPMFTPGENDDRPITHIVTAGGGAGLYFIVDAEPYMAASAKAHHYMALTVAGRTLTAKAIGLDGKEFDLFTITKDATGRPDAEWLRSALPEEPLAQIGHCLGESQISLTAVPTVDKPGTAVFTLTAGSKPMDYEIRVAKSSADAYRMDPVRGHCPGGEDVTVHVEVFAQPDSPTKVRASNLLLKPTLLLECAFETPGPPPVKGRIQSYPIYIEAGGD